MPCSLLKKQVVVKQPHYLKLQGKQEEANQTPRPWELPTRAPLSWAGLQPWWACWQAPVVAVSAEPPCWEQKRKEERKVLVPLQQAHWEAVAHSKESWFLEPTTIDRNQLRIRGKRRLHVKWSCLKNQLATHMTWVSIKPSSLELERAPRCEIPTMSGPTFQELSWHDTLRLILANSETT